MVLNSLQNNNSNNNFIIINTTNIDNNNNNSSFNNLTEIPSNYSDGIESNSMRIIAKFASHGLFYLANQNFASYASTNTETPLLLFTAKLANTTTATAVVEAATTKSQFIPVFEMVLGAVTYLVIIAMTVIGNILVVVAVFSYRPLKKVQNYFLVSLAASDLAVALIVMPLHVVKFLADGRWLLGVTLCQIFTTADILLCTSSIWNLCAIALDRYFAIHNPIDYAQKRTPKFVCSVIALVWLVSMMISVPPLIGWNDWSSQKLMDHCELTTEKAFVVYSASGSFFVPLAVMVVVYVKIFLSARQRIRSNRGRSALLRISNQATVKNSSEFVVPACTLTPMVCATTSSVAHILHRNRLSKNKQSQSVDKTEEPKCKNQRSMSQFIPTTMPHSFLGTKRFFGRYKRSNSTVCSLGLPTASQASTNKNQKRPEIELEQPTLDRPCNGIEAANDGVPNNSDGKKKIKLFPAIPPKNNPLFIINETTAGSLSKRNNGGESMISDDVTNTTTTTTSTTKSDDNRRCSTPMPLEKAQARFNDNMVLNNSDNKRKQYSNTDSLKLPSQPEQITSTVLKNREKISVAKEKRAAKTIAVIIFVFTFCWMPFFCVYVILSFCENCYLHPKVNQAVVWLGYINSSLNPFLYGILNLEFRRAFRKILCPKRFLNNPMTSIKR